MARWSTGEEARVQEKVERVSTFKYLGVQISEDQTCCANTEELMKKT